MAKDSLLLELIKYTFPLSAPLSPGANSNRGKRKVIPESTDRLLVIIYWPPMNLNRHTYTRPDILKELSTRGRVGEGVRPPPPPPEKEDNNVEAAAQSMECGAINKQTNKREHTFAESTSGTAAEGSWGCEL